MFNAFECSWLLDYENMAVSKQNIMAWLSDQNICAHDAILLKVRMPGVEPGSQAWEACMIPLHYMRSYNSIVVHGSQAVAQQHTS